MYKNGYFTVDKEIYNDPRYTDLSFEALTLYAFFRSEAQELNQIDESGKYYVNVTLNAVTKFCHCGMSKALRIMHELDDKRGAGLVHLKYCSNGRTRLILI